MSRPPKDRTPQERVRAAEKLSKQRSAASKKYDGKVLESGGMRVSLLLEREYAEPFEKLVSEHGSKKQAFVFLLKNYLQPNSTNEEQ